MAAEEEAEDNICDRPHDNAEAAAARAEDNNDDRHDNKAEAAEAGHICADVPNFYGRGVRYRFRG